MTTPKSPDFDELVGTDVPESERARLRTAHELLIAAGPPPELSPELEQVPWPEEALAPLGLSRRPGQRRRSRPQIVLAAAALLVFGFLIGQAFNGKSSSFALASTVDMHGTALAPQAVASIAVGQASSAGNWPMIVTVTNLPPARTGAYYNLWLSKNGKPIAFCGSFNTKIIGDTVVRMSAAYDLRPDSFNGWVVTRHAPRHPDRPWQIVLSTGNV